LGKSILFVDDERPILNTLQRTLRGSEFDVFIAADGQTALELLDREPIDIIVSDMRMPNMNGHQLLRKVKELYPTTIRIIMSGHAETHDVSKAMLDGSCKTYILKPWDSQSLQKTIRQLLDVRESLQEQKLLAIINSMDGLCSSPRIYHKLMDLIEQDADMHQIVNVIEEHPILAAKVLQMVNSAFYGRKTGSISQAIVFLGLGAVKNIVLTTSICRLLPIIGLGIFDREAVWSYANMTNRLVNLLYNKLLNKSIPHVASSVGLLYSIGLMLLVHKMPGKYAQIATALKGQPEKSLEQLEKEIVGVTHDNVGAYLLDWWGLPQPIIECAMFHHDPFNESVSDRNLVAIVHLADFYSARIQTGFGGQVDERVFGHFNITRGECELLVKERGW
jgi:HD-like signal output (HDOD) protein/CheY-like chemotaxis protein